MFTPRDTKTPGPSKMTREQRPAALGDGSRHDDGASQKHTPSPYGLMKNQFCLAYAARFLGLGARECGSGCERCDSHNTPIHEFYKALSVAGILGRFPPGARKWVQEILNKLAPSSTPAPSGASSAVVADLHNQLAAQSNQIAAFPAQFTPPRLGAPHAAGDCIASVSGCCNTSSSFTPYVASPTTQSFFATPTAAAASNLISFDDVRGDDVQTCCGPDEAYTAMLLCNGEMIRACEDARNRMSSTCMDILGGGAPLVTPHINFLFFFFLFLKGHLLSE